MLPVEIGGSLYIPGRHKGDLINGINLKWLPPSLCPVCNFNSSSVCPLLSPSLSLPLALSSPSFPPRPWVKRWRAPSSFLTLGLNAFSKFRNSRRKLVNQPLPTGPGQWTTCSIGRGPDGLQRSGSSFAPRYRASRSILLLLLLLLLLLDKAIFIEEVSFLFAQFEIFTGDERERERERKKGRSFSRGIFLSFFFFSVNDLGIYFGYRGYF